MDHRTLGMAQGYYGYGRFRVGDADLEHIDIGDVSSDDEDEDDGDGDGRVGGSRGGGGGERGTGIDGQQFYAPASGVPSGSQPSGFTQHLPPHHTSFLRLVPRIARPAHIPPLGLVKLLMLPPLGLVKLLMLPPPGLVKLLVLPPLGLIKLLMLPLLGLVKLLMLLPLFPRLHVLWQPIVLKICDLPPFILKLNTLL
ncbi:hypothetical protein K466DRAFT_568086, partial [Polyporus arcularius HHB13444]